jgi:protein arginine kinase activator
MLIGGGCVEDGLPPRRPSRRRPDQFENNLDAFLAPMMHSHCDKPLGMGANADFPTRQGSQQRKPVMKCERCGKHSAAVKLTRIEKTGQAVQILLCQVCAAEVSPFQKNILQKQASFDLLLKELVKQQQQADPAEEFGGEVPTCHTCGLDFTAYRKTFMLGCPDCYESFEEWLEPDLRRLHRAARHIGAAPGGSAALAALNEQIRTCREELKSAVEFEDYERAAFLRDEIARLEQEIHKEAESHSAPRPSKSE